MKKNTHTLENWFDKQDIKKCYFCKKLIKSWKKAFFSSAIPANLNKSFWKTKDYPVHIKCHLKYIKQRRLKAGENK